MNVRWLVAGHLVLGALVCAACGGNKPAPLTADDSAGSGDSDGGGSDPAMPDTTGGSSSGGGGAGAADPAAGPGPVACVASAAVCSETLLAGQEASDAKERCKSASGEPRDGECSRDAVVATCVIEAKKVTMYFYKDKDAAATKGILKSAKTSCTNAGGAFTKTGGGGGGGGGKKPKKKK